MERTFSVDDLVGGIWRLGQAGMGRTDSEAAFQEFLKRIPSATNLAAAANASQQLEHSQQLHQQAQLALHNGPGTSVAPPSSHAATSLPDVSSGLTGIPRVPSLDLLRQLVIQNQLSHSLNQPIVKSETPASGTVCLCTGGIASSLVMADLPLPFFACSIHRQYSAFGVERCSC